MSLIVTVYVREGIVMAADSRLTLTFPRIIAGVAQPSAAQHTVSVTSSDSARKVFHTPNGVGISAFGLATVNGAPIAGVVESFIIEQLTGKSLPPRETADALLSYFKSIGVQQATVFHVAGYRPAGDTLTQEIVNIDLATGTTSILNQAGRQGANWGGEVDVFQRLTLNVATIDAQGAVLRPIPTFSVPFEYFTLQDAIDFASYAIRATIDTMRFQAREKTVGGPIDVLVITPDSARWIAQKQLAVS